MTDHLVQQTETSTHVHLVCHTCDWSAVIGHTRTLSYEQRVGLQPLATMVKWAHIDPSLIAPANDGEAVERTAWRRVRDYLLKGVP